MGDEGIHVRKFLDLLVGRLARAVTGPRLDADEVRRAMGIGVLLGRHPMAPSVSPKKTWEGLAGSLVLACVVGVVGAQVAFHAQPVVGVVLGLATVATATLGDLSESMLKRDLGLKDMGHLLPGHGGLLDRLDSLLLTAPAVWLVLTILVPAS